MKKLLTVVLSGMLVAMLAGPSHAAAKSATLYLHGVSPVGEADLSSTWIDSAWYTMDATKPADATPKSTFVTNYLAGPNTTCSGNGLLPTWRGSFAGKIKKLSLTLNTIGSPAASITVDVFADGTGGCESSLGSTGYSPPSATATVDVAPGPGQTKIDFTGFKPFKTAASLVIMVSVPNAPNPGQVRLLFDGSGYESALQVN